ncbi:MAG TPA: choice-of-anchor tandem repeat NxxGxxAF-containing protein, partial [Allocoleopsis sp.]
LFSSPSSNDKGNVAFVAELDNGESGVFVGLGEGKVKTIASSVGTFDDFLSDPAINERGKVAFQAILDDGSEGIFTGSNPITDKVIAVGDTLAGSTVTQLIFTGREAFNSKGQVVFTAFLSDGSEGIFRADPSCGSIKPVVAHPLV